MHLEGMWLFVVLGGAILLGLAIAYGLVRARRTTPAAEAARDAGTRAQYHKDEPAYPADPGEAAPSSDSPELIDRSVG